MARGVGHRARLAHTLSPDDLGRLAAVADDAIDALRPALSDDEARRTTYGRVLGQRIAEPLTAQGIHVARGSWSIAST